MPLLCRRRETDVAHAGRGTRGAQDATMDSESARMSSAAEARYRIDYPNSKPRVVKGVGPDAASEQGVKRVAERQWQRAAFFTSIKFDGAPTRADEPGSGRVSGVSAIELASWPPPPLPAAPRADEPGAGRVSGVRAIELPRWPLAPLASAARADEPGSGRVSGVRAMELPHWPLASAAGGAGWAREGL